MSIFARLSLRNFVACFAGANLVAAEFCGADLSSLAFLSFVSFARSLARSLFRSLASPLRSLVRVVGARKVVGRNGRNRVARSMHTLSLFRSSSFSLLRLLCAFACKGQVCAPKFVRSPARSLAPHNNKPKTKFRSLARPLAFRSRRNSQLQTCGSSAPQRNRSLAHSLASPLGTLSLAHFRCMQCAHAQRTRVCCAAQSSPAKTTTKQTHPNASILCPNFCSADRTSQYFGESELCSKVLSGARATTLQQRQAESKTQRLARGCAACKLVRAIVAAPKNERGATTTTATTTTTTLLN